MNVYETVSQFFNSYQGKKRVIGKSEGGSDLFVFFVGEEEGPIGISQAAIHGREFITAYLSLKMIEKGVHGGGFWVIPLANPDGALLSEVGLSSVNDPLKRSFLLNLNGKNYDFSLWKANLNGVDLNVNFDAKWGMGSQNVFSPGPQNYVGKFPFSESETIALKKFTQEISPQITLSLHTKGDEIYWHFFQEGEELLRDQQIAERFSKALGLPLREAFMSVGGYKDWCIEKLKIPAFTVEIGSENETHPIKTLSNLKRYFDALNAVLEAYLG